MKFKMLARVMRLAGVSASLVLFLSLFLMTGAARMAYAADEVDVSQYVSITTAHENSSLDRVTRIITSTADVTITNTSTRAILFPFHAVININGTSYENVQMPDALGGYGTQPYGKYFYEWVKTDTAQLATVFGRSDCNGDCAFDADKDGDVDGSDLAFASNGSKLDPGQKITFKIRFQRPSSVTFTYNIKCYGIVSAGNNPPVADAGPNRTYVLPAGQSQMQITLDGSGSGDSDGTIVSYQWTGTPDPENVVQPTLNLSAGTYTFTLVVTDDAGAQSPPDQVTITVQETGGQQGHPPVLSVEHTSYSVDEGSTLSFDVSASDEDGDPVVISALPKLENAAFSSVSGTNATGTFTFTPEYDQQGIYIIEFKARDPLGMTDSKTVRITVNNVNRPPELTVPESVSVDEGSLITIPVKASDPDGEILTLSASPLPENSIFIPATGSITFAPDFDQAGTYDITCTASDGRQQVSTVVHITVNDVTGGTGQPHALILNVNPVESPTLLTSAKITGSVNAASNPSAPKITSAVLTSVDPSSAQQGQTLDVVLTGEVSGEFTSHFDEGLSQVDFGQGITVNSIEVNSPSSITANITIEPDALLGVRSITVFTGTEKAISLVAFNVIKGKSIITGTVLDTVTHQPIEGASVTVQGASISSSTSADGNFSLNDVPAGGRTLVITAANHESKEIVATSEPESSSSVGTIELAPTVVQQGQVPPGSFYGVLPRIFVLSGDKRSINEMQSVVVDAICLVGGKDVGILDEYGNQLNPNVVEQPYFQLKSGAVKSIAMRMKSESPETFGEILWEFTNMWQWEKKPNLLMWLNAFQDEVNKAWQDPDSPRSRMFVLLFNNGKTLSADPPTITPDIPLNALQATLLRLAFFKMAAQLMNPDLVLQYVPDDYFAQAGLPNDTTKVAQGIWQTVINKWLKKSSLNWLKNIGEIFPDLTSACYADDTLIARVAHSSENAWVGRQLFLDATGSIVPHGVNVVFDWQVVDAPPGSLGNQQFRYISNDLMGLRKRIIGFEPDVAGEYTIQLVIRTEDGSQESDPFEIAVTARHWPCDPRGLDPEWDDTQIVNMERPLINVMCTMAVDEAVSSLGKELDELVVDDLKTIIKDNLPFGGDGEDLSYSAFNEFKNNGTIAGDFDSRMKMEKMFMERMGEDIKLKNKKTLETNPEAYEKYMPDALLEAKDSGDSSKFTKVKNFMVEQLVVGTLSYFQDEADKLGESIMYAFMDKMVDDLIVSLRPAPPSIHHVEVLASERNPDRKVVYVIFRRSPDDPGPEAKAKGVKSNQHFYYRLWRENKDGLASIAIGPEGKDVFGGPVAFDKDEYEDLLLFVDINPPEGSNTYYVQTRRIIGKSVPNVNMWNEAEFWFSNLVLGDICPPAAAQYNFSKGLFERMYRILTEIKLQDSDLSSPEFAYVPRPFDRPAPIISLAKSPDGDLFMSMPWANAVFGFRGANVIPLFSCSFKEPHQTGFAIDQNEYFYAVNAASESQFGGRIFRWNSSGERQFFGSVNYYSRLLHYAKPCATQSMVAGMSWGEHRLFLTDLYSNTLRYLDIPFSGELPPGDLFHNCSHALVGSPDITPLPQSSLTIQQAGDVLMTQGDNIFWYRRPADFGFMFDNNKPFQSLTGIDSDEFGNIYVADAALGTITEIPREKQRSDFYNELVNDSATRSLYTLATGIDEPGELRIGGSGTSLVWLDSRSYNSRQFGLSGRILDGATGMPLDFAKVYCEGWGDNWNVVTDEYGVFHIPGLLLPGYTPPKITLLIRDRLSRSMTVIVKELERTGETFIDPLIFTPDVIPTPSGNAAPNPPPNLFTVPIQIPPPTGSSIRYKPILTTISVPIDDPLGPPPDPQNLNSIQAPKIEIVSPVDGATVDEQQIEVYGVVDNPAINEVTIDLNGTQYTVPVTDRVFRRGVVLRESINSVVASALLTINGQTARGTSRVHYIQYVSTPVTQTHCISGVVTDQNSGFPIVNAQVSIQNTGFYTYTDSLGVWFMCDIPEGEYSLDILP